MIEIILAQDAHSAEIAEIEKICFSQPWSEESIHNHLADPQALFFAAKESKTICGYISGSISFETVFVYNLAVREEYRRRGVGLKLLNVLEDASRFFGASLITLEVRESNLAAIKLYEKLGYTIIGKRGGFYAHPAEDAYIMNKDLGAGKNRL